MAGWLYVISGISFALLGIAAVLPPRSLLGLVVQRLPIQPVTAGDDLTVELEICNQTNRPVTLLQVQDILQKGRPQAPEEQAHSAVFRAFRPGRGSYT
jgi:uncharacterized protein (DUF58 family)